MIVEWWRHFQELFERVFYDLLSKSAERFELEKLDINFLGNQILSYTYTSFEVLQNTKIEVICWLCHCTIPGQRSRKILIMVRQYFVERDIISNESSHNPCQTLALTS